MSARKSERLVNLLIALLSTRRYLTKRELRETVEGYRASKSDAAFERQFERDKEELRNIGVSIETGSNDLFFEDEEGYRINRAEFELPPLTFTPEELSALGLAGQVWISFGRMKAQTPPLWSMMPFRQPRPEMWMSFSAIRQAACTTSRT